MAVHTWTTDEYLQMAEAGVLAELKVELLAGQVVDLTPQGDEHFEPLRDLIVWFSARADRMIVQMPLIAGEGWVPEPDIALLHDPPRTGIPRSAALVVEVVVSRRREAHAKLPGYALAAVTQVWVVDVPRGVVEVFTAPGDGGYAEHATLRGDDVLDPGVEGVPARTVAELLGSG